MLSFLGSVSFPVRVTKINVMSAQHLVKSRLLNRSNLNINFLPLDFQKYIIHEIKNGCIYLKLSPPRKSKLGDYRYNYQQKSHAISVNIDLSPIQFLITFIHELAHKKCFDKYKGKVVSHGKEWKSMYIYLLEEAKSRVSFSEEELRLVNQYINYPRASSFPYKEVEKGKKKVADLAEQSKFKLENGRVFQLLTKRRTRYLCTDLNNGKLYTVSGNATVEAEL